MRSRLIVRALAIALLGVAGEHAGANEVDLNGSWQWTLDCGNPIVLVQSVGIVEDVATGAMTFEISDCGTLFLDGGIRKFAACSEGPFPGAVSGGLMQVPVSGFFPFEAQFESPFVSPTFGCEVLPVARYTVDLHHEGIVTDNGAGVGVRIDGNQLVGVVRGFDTADDLCAEFDYGGQPVCVSMTMLRNQLSTGADVTVEPFPGASLSAANVSAGGTATITPLTEASATLPANFQVADLAIYYDVTTTAAVSGLVTVCLPYPDANDDGLVDDTTPAVVEGTLRLLHEEGGLFVDRTVSLDPIANVICAETESLSQFVFGASTVTCGNGVVDGGEDCDQGAGANGAVSSCCTASCTFRSGGEVCRPSTGECDGAAETCTGASGACPANVVATAGTPCTADGNDCTTDECDGFGTCGTISGAGACDDGDFCTTGDTCNGVVCTGGPPPPCDDGDPCTMDSCSAGACVHPDAPDGTACDDGDVCTAGDECESGLCVSGTPACGTEVQIAGTKLVVVDKETVANKAKVVFVAKDPAITKGTGTDAATISAALDIRYDAEDGGFTLEAGASNGTAGWLVNKTTVAKYVNKNAPGNPTEAKVAVIKPGKVLKLVGKGLGDRKLDILAAGAPSGDVTVVYAVANGGELFRHCTAFSACAYKPIAAGTGAKLVCKNGTPVACPLPASPSGAFLE